MPKYGDIVLVIDMPSSAGSDPKTRPAVVVTKDTDLDAGKPIVVAGISTRKPGYAVDPWSVPMQYDPNRHPVTGLKADCSAFARWLVVIDLTRIKGPPIGRTPHLDMVRIAVILDRFKRQN